LCHIMPVFLLDSLIVGTIFSASSKWETPSPAAKSLVEGAMPAWTVAREWLTIALDAYRGWRVHDGTLLSAAIAFYAMLSLSPLLVIAVAVTALVLEPERASRYLTEVVAQVANEQMAGFAQEVLRNTQRPTSAFSAAGGSLLLMLFGAARLFRQLKAAVNIVWETRGHSQGIRAMLNEHLIAMLMVLMAAVGLVAWLGIDVVLSAVSSRLVPHASLWRWGSSVAGWGLLTLLFGAAYRLLPDARVPWRDVWAGAAIGALLFVLCKLVVSVYLGLTGVHSAYGAASAAVVLLLWAYFSTQAFLFGAEWAKAVWARRRSMPTLTPRR
jgi:membrane protein